MRKLVALMLLAPLGAFALPQGGVVQEGAASWEQTGAGLTVNQGSDRALLDWNSFDIANGETVRFVQPGTGSVAINRVVGDSLLPSQIDGNLFANGNVWILNPNGVLLGGNAKFDVGGLAIGAGVLGEDDSWNLTGNVTNNGEIKAGAGGVVLGGREVVNSGKISTRNGGGVTLAAGQKMQVGLLNGLVTVAAEPSDVPLRVENTGEIVAPGGTVGLMMQAVDAGVGGAMNVGGRIVANTVGEEGGVIRLGYAPEMKVSGELLAEGNDAGEKGGRIEVVGGFVDVGSGARLSADGEAGGGNVLVGGDYRGAALAGKTARNVDVAAGAVLTASAKSEGDGGKVVVWGDNRTRFAGHVAADGAGVGDGGLMEVSGKNTLVFRGTGSALGGTAGGKKGVLLLDPEDIVIANGAGGADDAQVGDGTIGAGENPGGTYTISEQSLEALGAGTDVVLEATRHITIQDLTDNVLNLAATGNVTMVADSDLDGVGDFIMNAGDSIVTPADLTLRGANVNLGSLNTSGGNGNLVLETTNSAGTVLLGGTLNAGTGGLTLAGNLQRVAGLDLTNVGAVTLSGNSALTGGTIIMDAANAVGGAYTLDATGNAVTLAGLSGLTGVTVNAAAAAVFLDDVAINGDFDVTAGSGIVGIGPWNVTTGGGALTLNNPLTMTGATSLNSGGGLMQLGAVDGPYALTLDSGAGNTVMNGVAGGGTPLASFAHSGNALSTVGVRTTGAQTYNAATTAQGTVQSTAGNIDFNDDLTLGGNTVVQVAGANTVDFGGTVDGPHDLNVTMGTGIANFAGQVGGVTPLANLTTAGHVDLNDTVQVAGNIMMTGGPVHVAGDVTAGGDLTMGNTVELWDNVVLTSGGLNGDVLTLGNVVGGVYGVTLAAGAGQAVLNGFDLTTLNLLSGNGVTLNAGSYTNDGAMDWSNMGALALGGNVVMTAGAGPLAALTLGTNNDVTGNGHNLSLTGSTVTLDGMAGVNVLTVNGSGIAVNADIATTGAQTYTGPVTLGGDLTSTNDDIAITGAVTLAGNRTIDTGAGAGNITLGSTVDGASDLTLNAGTGDVDILGDIGSVTPLTSLNITAFESWLRNVRTSGGIDIYGDLTLTGLMEAGTYIWLHDDLLAGTGAAMTAGSDLTVDGQIALVDDLVLTSGGGAADVLTLGNGVIGDRLLTLVAGAGDLNINGDIDVDALALVSGDDMTYGGGTIATDNDMNFTNLNRLLLAGDTVMTAEDGGVRADITFGSGNQILATTPGVDLTMTGETITLHQIGDTGAGALESLTVNAGTVVMLGNIYTTGNQTINATQGLAGLLFSAGGDIVLNTSAMLVGDVQVQSNGGNVYFQDVLNGAYGLTVDAGGGNVYVNAALGQGSALGYVTMDGAIIMLDNNITTLGDQRYTANSVNLGANLRAMTGDLDFDAPVTVAGHASARTGSGNIRFRNTVDGAGWLTLAAGTGDITAEAAVGENQRLNGLTVENAANVNWQEGVRTEDYTQSNVTGMTQIGAPGILAEDDLRIANSGGVRGHLAGREIRVQARDGWIGTVEAREHLTLAGGFTYIHGTVLGMRGRSAALATTLGSLLGGPHYLNDYVLPLAELSMPVQAATAPRCQPWYEAYGTQAPSALGLPDDGLWVSCLDWPDAWDTVGNELWVDVRAEPAAGELTIR